MNHKILIISFGKFHWNHRYLLRSFHANWRFDVTRWAFKSVVLEVPFKSIQMRRVWGQENPVSNLLQPDSARPTQQPSGFKQRKKTHWWCIQTRQLSTGRLHKQCRPTATSVRRETRHIKSLLNIYLPRQVSQTSDSSGGTSASATSPPSPPTNPPGSAPSATGDAKSKIHARVSVI